MKRIIIDIKVQNIIEIIRKRRGRIAGFLSKYFLSQERLKEEVESRIVDEIQETVDKTLKIRLFQEGIQARISVKQVDATGPPDVSPPPLHNDQTSQEPDS